MNTNQLNSKASHTPGPWDAIQDLGGHPRSWRVEPHNGPSRLATNLKEGDARLIAAAPDLLEFVIKFLDNFKDCTVCDGTGFDYDLDMECLSCKGTKMRIDSTGVLYVELPEEARALIAKAKGE